MVTRATKKAANLGFNLPALHAEQRTDISNQVTAGMALRLTAARVARDARLKLPIGTQKFNPVQFLGKSLSSSIIQSSESEESQMSECQLAEHGVAEASDGTHPLGTKHASTLKTGQLGKRQYPKGVCKHCEQEKQ